MSNKVKNFRYDRLFPPGLHRFVTRGIVEILSNFKPEEVKWWALINDRIDLEWFAKKMGAKDLGKILDWFPGGGIRTTHWNRKNYTQHLSLIERYDEQDDGWESRQDLVIQDELYRFDGPVYAGRVVFIDKEYGAIIPVACHFVAGPDQAKVEAFKNLYLKEERERNKRVLNYSGIPVSSFRPMKWEDIFLPDGMAEQIRDSCNSFFKAKDVYVKHNVDWKFGMLFMGPPGNGKTAVCRAIATSTEVPIIYCSLSDAEPHIILASLPRTIRNNAPCVLMIEDVDAMADTVSMRAGFLNILDGLTGEAGLLTIASTNSPEKLDPAFSARPSRFDELYHFKDPTEEMRKAILFRKLGKNFSEKELSKVAKQTSGLSAAFVQEIAIKALRSSFLKGKPITIKDLVAATERVKGHIADSSVEWTGRIGFS